MRVLVTHAPKKMSIEEREIPQLGAGEVLVQTRAVGLCGSDIHLYAGTHPYRTYPAVFGHEASGRVNRIGEGVQGFNPGDHVVLEPLIPCGTCYPCRIGRTNCCERMRTIGVNEPGALADFFKVPSRCLHKVSEDLDPRIASFCEPFSVGIQANYRGDIGENDNVLIIGAGPIGLAVLAAAKQRGAKVAVADLIDQRLKIAEQLGADLVFNVNRVDLGSEIKEWTQGDMASVVVEAAGNPKTIERTVQLVSFAGRVVIVGVTEEPANVRGVDITKRELSIYGSRNNLGRFKEAVKYVSEHPQSASKMITHEYSYNEVIDAFKMAEAHPEQICKVMINFEK